MAEVYPVRTDETRFGMNRLGGYLLAVYIGISPVYWLPGISPAVLGAVKYLIIGAALFCIWSNAMLSGGINLPLGLCGLLGPIVIIVSASPGFFQADTGEAIKRFVDVFLGFIMLWTIYQFMAKNGDVVRVLTLSAWIIAGWCLLTVTNWFLGFPNWQSPSVFVTKPLWMGGFGSARTGWSNGVAFFSPILFVVMFLRKHASRLRYLYSVLGVLPIIGSQIASGGRTGLLTSLVSLFSILFFLNIRLALACLAVTVIGLVTMADFLFEHFRFNRLDRGMDFDTLADFSSGRLDQYVLALQLIGDRPLTGYGFGTIESILQDVFGWGRDIHNVWLRMAAEAGVWLPLAFGLFVGSLLIRGYVFIRRHRSSGSLKPRLISVMLFFVLANGFIISQFEPNVLLGTFQNCAVWWVAAGTVAYLTTHPESGGISSS